jgi:hypothetical protein
MEVRPVCLGWKPGCNEGNGALTCGYPNTLSDDCLIKIPNNSDTPIFTKTFLVGDRTMVCALAGGQVYGESEETRQQCSSAIQEAPAVYSMAANHIACPAQFMPILLESGGIECLRIVPPVIEIESAGTT